MTRSWLGAGLVTLAIGCKPPTPAPAAADLDVSEITRLIPAKTSSPEGWARDVRDAVARAGWPSSAEPVCQVLAIIEQESGYQTDPPVPGLGRIVRAELDGLFSKLGPAAAPARKALLDHVGPGGTGTFEERLGQLRTEAQADRLYREIVTFHRDRHPALARILDVVSPGLIEARNPITTAGSMQVSVKWAIDHGAREGLSPAQVRERLYTRRGGVRYGTARLLGYPASYDQAIYRFADYNAGLHGLVALLSALYLREQNGSGQYIDLAMLDVMLATDDYANFALDEIPLTRGGGEVWEAPGGPIMITGDFRVIWKLLVRFHGVVDPTPQGASLEQKIALRRQAVADFMLSFDDRAKLTAALDSVNLAWGDVRSTAAAYRSPTARSRGVVAQVDDRGGETRPTVQSPYRFSQARSGVAGGPAYRGEHNREVLEQWLGASPEEIARLERSGILQAEEQA